MALELPGQLRTSMAVPALRSLPAGLAMGSFHQESSHSALSQVCSTTLWLSQGRTGGATTSSLLGFSLRCCAQLSNEQLCAKVRALEAENAELRLQVQAGPSTHNGAHRYSLQDMSSPGCHVAALCSLSHTQSTPRSRQILRHRQTPAPLWQE